MNSFVSMNDEFSITLQTSTKPTIYGTLMNDIRIYLKFTIEAVTENGLQS